MFCAISRNITIKKNCHKLELFCCCFVLHDDIIVYDFFHIKIFAYLRNNVTQPKDTRKLKSLNLVHGVKRIDREMNEC